MNKLKLILALFLVVCSSANGQHSNDCIFRAVQTVDKKPVYTEANGDLIKHIISKIKFPEEVKKPNFKDLIFVDLTIDCTGKIANIVSTNYDEEVICEEVERVLRTLEKWEPASLHGKTVSTTMMLILAFEENEDTKEFEVYGHEFVDYVADVIELDTDENAQDVGDCTFAETGTLDQRPVYTAANGDLIQHIVSKIQFPEEVKKADIQEVVFVDLTIDCTGHIADIELTNDVEILCEEVERVLRTLENWEPAVKNGKAVSTTIELLVSFEDDEDTKEFKVYGIEFVEFEDDEVDLTVANAADNISFIAPIIISDDIVELDDSDAISLAQPEDYMIGIDISDMSDSKTIVAESCDQKPFVTVEQMPSFPGGESQMNQFLSKNIKYPESAIKEGIQGRVTIRFVVGTTGELSDIQVLRGRSPELDNEAVRVINDMPKWIAGRQNGMAVPVYFTLPITFQLP